MSNVETSMQRSGGTLGERRSDGPGRRTDHYASEQARGNETPKPAVAADPHLKRVIAGDDGAPILIEEESGAAWAEGVRPSVPDAAANHATAAPASHATAAGGAMPLSQRVTSAQLTPLLWAGGGLLAALAARALYGRRRNARTTQYYRSDLDR